MPDKTSVQRTSHILQHARTRMSNTVWADTTRQFLTYLFPCTKTCVMWFYRAELKSNASPEVRMHLNQTVSCGVPRWRKGNFWQSPYLIQLTFLRVHVAKQIMWWLGREQAVKYWVKDTGSRRPRGHSLPFFEPLWDIFILYIKCIFQVKYDLISHWLFTEISPITRWLCSFCDKNHLTNK